MVIKNLTKKVIVSSVMAGSLFVLPQLAPHHASAHSVSISTTHQILSYGSVGCSVRAVQTKLVELGFYHDAIDGDYGPHTRSAVISFQKAHHLSTDGVAGPITLGKLFGSSASPAPKTRTSSHSSSVKSLQSDLKKLGYYHDSIDGLYGPNTRSAVMAFQKANRLVVDGIAGPHTLAKLNGSSPISATPVSNASPSTNHTQTVSTSSTASLVDGIITHAKALEGITYQWGGTTTSGFDCSGFTQYVFAESGITIPRTSAQQYASGRYTSLTPGALVFFHTTSSSVSHVGIYIGNNEFISSSSSHGVSITSMNNPYWKPRYMGAKTYITNMN